MPTPAEIPPRPSTTLGAGSGLGTGELISHLPHFPHVHGGQRARRILHLDVDAFLASVEQAMHPELKGLALVIGGMPGDRNLVMSSSYEARAFGVRPGMLLAEAARRCPRAIFRRGDSQAANRLRERTAHLLGRYSPLVEVASIDDFFVDLSACARIYPRAFDAAETMRREIREEVDLPVTIGIGTSRMLARMAGKLAKPGGIAEIFPGGELAFLGPLPVDSLPGVGHSIGACLERFAIRTIADLRQVSREVLFASFGSLGLVLWERARGIDEEPVEPTYAQQADGSFVLRIPAALQRDSTFEPEEGRREHIEAMLAYIVERAAHRLRVLGATARSLEVRVRYVDTRPTRELESDDSAAGRSAATLGKRVALAEATDSTDALLGQARMIYGQLPRRRALVKRIGITLHGLSARSGWQGQLFSDPRKDGRAKVAEAASASHADRQHAVDRALDRLRAKYGFGGMLRGASLPLAADHARTRDGFVLRTPSLNQ
ncbi:MAG TPA: DNA polymerase IV [Planctomycetota bacterium]|nr:DNA polymerase IV [Planctomycetota bacterium]